MRGTKFVVDLPGSGFQVWHTFQTQDDDGVQRFWLERTGISCVEEISQEEYWDLSLLCRGKKGVFMGYVK